MTLHPYLSRVLLSTPFAVTSYFLIWYVPAVEQGKVLWYLVFYCLFQSLQTVSTAGRSGNLDKYLICSRVKGSNHFNVWRYMNIHLVMSLSLNTMTGVCSEHNR